MFDNFLDTKVVHDPNGTLRTKAAKADKVKYLKIDEITDETFTWDDSDEYQSHSDTENFSYTIEKDLFKMKEVLGAIEGIIENGQPLTSDDLSYIVDIINVAIDRTEECKWLNTHVDYLENNIKKVQYNSRKATQAHKDIEEYEQWCNSLENEIIK